MAALQELRARYILLCSSNILDQLFLTNFLQRNYADGRGGDRGFGPDVHQERGSTGLNGVMTLSAYPLFPLERDWTEHQSLPADDRVFSGDTIEGTYGALRLLLNSSRLNGGKLTVDGCHVSDDGAPFVPTVACTEEPPIPDYSPTFWTLKDQCGEMKKDNTDSIA